MTPPRRAPVRLVLLILVTIALPALLAGCLSAGARDAEPRFRFRSLPDRTSPLYFALREANQVTDISNRIFVFSEIGSAYIDRQAEAEARAVLMHLEALAGGVSSRRERAEILVELATLYVRLDEPEPGLRLLRTALELASGLADQELRGGLYERIIQAGIEAGETGFPVVADTINQVLVMDDLYTRATVLTNTAERYQRRGLGQSGNVIIQQAIPAAGSIRSPWNRATALASVALSLQAAGDMRSSGVYADRAADQLIGLTVLSLPEADARIIAEVAGKLAAMGRFSAAAQVVAVIPQAHIRAEALVALGQAYAASGDRSSAFVVFTRAASEAERSGNALLIAAAYANIAHGYLSIGEEQLAYLNAEFAQGVMSRENDDFARAAILERLAEIYVAVGAGPQLEQDVAELGSLFPRVQATVAVSRAYAAAGQPDNAAAALASIEAVGESLVFTVLQQYAVLFRIEEALRLLEEIDSPFLRARALAAIGSARGPGGSFYSGPIVVP